MFGLFFFLSSAPCTCLPLGEWSGCSALSVLVCCSNSLKYNLILPRVMLVPKAPLLSLGHLWWAPQCWGLHRRPPFATDRHHLLCGGTSGLGLSLGPKVRLQCPVLTLHFLESDCITQICFSLACGFLRLHSWLSKLGLGGFFQASFMPRYFSLFTLKCKPAAKSP